MPSPRGNWGGGGGERPPLGGTVVLFAIVTAIIGYGSLKSGALSKVTFIYFAALVPSVILHEISHGWLADRFGDPTARSAGRLTLNPLRHVDILGTFIIPGVLLLTGHSAFGYAKPVPVNTAQMSRNKSMMVGLIGPITNLLLVAVATVTIHIVYAQRTSLNESTAQWTFTTLLLFGRANIVLAIFNLIPIPPLDGSSVVERFLPQKYMYQYLQFRRYAMILLLVLMLAYGKVLTILFDPAIRFWINTFTPFEIP